MELMQLKGLILSWGLQHVSKSFNEKHMEAEISSLGLDSIDIIQLCEYLEEQVNTDIDVDFDFIIECKNLNTLVKKIIELPLSVG
ncbi:MULTISPECIES: acyl carrier protein [unclassified Serratia (in: enterobacteria)]|uniref:acyl carrier protein n=1 Tax=unclassified Serratia (in: enterobacteria) TaxID=2647522 RepID=UPI003075EE77